MKKTNAFGFIALFMLAFVQTYAQTQVSEEEVSPTGNVQIQAVYDNLPAFKFAPAPGDTIGIPVFDDFSQQPYIRPFINNPELAIYPNSSIWLDKKVFINHKMADNPPTIGVATFDGTDSTGRAYDLNFLDSDTADVLTSKPIRLANPTDSVFLSFWYQPGGLSEAPNGSGTSADRFDSLRVEFRSPSYDWTVFKSIPGTASKDFEIVMIAVPDSFHENGFQFRFTNLGSLGGVFDTWHIDYVFLDQGRSYADTTIVDPAFVKPHPNVLNDFQQIPWNHYLPNQAIANKTQVRFSVMNYQTNPRAFRVRNQYFDHNQAMVFNRPSPGLPFSVAAKTLLDSIVPYNADMTTIPVTVNDKFTTRSKIFLDQPTNFTVNDTVLFEQVFDNHYAYDDGTGEKAYGVSNAPGLRIAYKYTPLMADTLRGLKIFFQQAEINATNNSFTIVVWDVGADGKPGNIVYESDSVYKPRYYFSPNEFITYRLEESQYISGPFFVGIRKTFGGKLNIGLDKNNNSRENLYIRPFGETWRQSTIEGALMMRPIFGEALVNDLGTEDPVVSKGLEFTFKVYPNPTSGYINVDIPTNEVQDYKYTIMDAYGRVREQQQLEQTIDVNQLEPGLYFIQLSNQKNGNVSTQKFIVAY